MGQPVTQSLLFPGTVARGMGCGLGPDSHRQESKEEKGARQILSLMHSGPGTPTFTLKSTFGSAEKSK